MLGKSAARLRICAARQFGMSCGWYTASFYAGVRRDDVRFAGGRIDMEATGGGGYRWRGGDFRN